MSNRTGYDLVKFPSENKGTSFSLQERRDLHIEGLVPGGAPLSLEVKVRTALAQLRDKPRPIDKYIFVQSLQDSDETLYYALLLAHTAEVMPLVYTPVVGEACQKWSHIYRQQPRGVYITLEHLGRVRSVLENYPVKDIRAIVFTDGERILGLGDLGANGMGIPVGKLALYSALAGVHPSHCLPVHLDVGTDTQSILDDEAYVGLKRRRDRSQQYDDLIDEFFTACQELYGRNVLLQFEDFGNTNAFRLLHHYQSRACTFNDDIQGTSSVVLAGLISSLGISKTKSLNDHTYLFHGAGEAGAGIASLIADTIAMETGCTIEAARSKIWLVDSKGLITSSRDLAKLEHHKLPFAHSTGPIDAVSSDPLFNAVNHVKPTALIGVSAQGGAFTQAIVEEVCKYSEHPVIFALSNPTSKSECTAEQAYRWTNGRCVFASGSPFDPVSLEDGRRFVPGQGNNAYIFPGVGLAAVVTKASSIVDKDFIVAARSLAAEVSEDDLKTGCAYPPLSRIREVSLKIAAAVAQEFYDTGRATIPLPEGVDVTELCRRAMYIPSYTA